MHASSTYHHSDPPGSDMFMVVADRAEWEAIVQNVDGIGHSPEMMNLLNELKKWGITK